MKITEEEKELILRKREKDLEDSIYRSAISKCDLYYCSFDQMGCCGSGIMFVEEFDYSFVSKEDIEKALEKIKNIYDSYLVLKKGTKFVSYLENGVEEWYDDERFGIEGMENDWAEKYLTNFKQLR